MPGFPSRPNPLSEYCSPDIISLSTLCPQVSRIPGIPTVVMNMSLTWVTEKGSLLKRLPTKGVIFDTSNYNEKEMKNMISLVPSCPKAARMPGFPSRPNPLSVYSSPNIISLSTLCPQVSRIPGIPSVVGNMSLTWATEKGSLLKRLPKKGVIFDTSNYNEKTMKNMVSFVPSCPKVSTIPGFPFIPNPKTVYYGLNIVNLLPLCTAVSTISGCSSVEGHEEKGWVTELGSLMNRPQKKILFRINSSPTKIDEQNMHSLVPCCPGASKIPGFPSYPRYNMLSLVPVCPKVCSFPGCASSEGASKFKWLFDPHTLWDFLTKETILLINTPTQDGETVKGMLALAPSCPEASRIPGFPSAPQTKSKIEPNIISFVPCCPSVSSLKGFASMTTTPSTEWLHEAKPIWKKPQQKRTDVTMTLDGQDQLDCPNIKSMVTLVTSCPKEARACGFPSAQVVNRPPNMVSLYTSTPCVSCVPGFPSARMLSSEHNEIQTRTPHREALFNKQQNEKIVLIVMFPAKLKQDEIKSMVAMAPSCPHWTKTPGFPSILQFNQTEEETMATQLSFSTEKHTSPELPIGQSAESYPKETRIPGVPFTSVSSQSTELTHGEIDSVTVKLKYHFISVSCV